MNELSPASLYPNARIDSDGKLLFPHRGDPPKFVIQGYIQDKSDLFIYRPILKPCAYRINSWKKACGGMRQAIECTLFKQKVTVGDCLCCTKQEPPITEPKNET